jgi:DNA-directed RNA polymerase subunit RPC12/RpoP
MPLITCPDCSKELSDQALSCPHCGRPVAHKLVTPRTNSNNSTLKTILMIAGVGVVIGVGILILWSIGWNARKQAANREREVAAIQTLDNLRKIQADYAIGNKRQYGTFGQLVKAGALEAEQFSDDRLAIYGYVFTMKITPGASSKPVSYSINADPAGDSGGRHFYIDPNITSIRVHDTRPATAGDPSIIE